MTKLRFKESKWNYGRIQEQNKTKRTAAMAKTPKTCFPRLDKAFPSPTLVRGFLSSLQTREEVLLPTSTLVWLKVFCDLSRRERTLRTRTKGLLLLIPYKSRGGCGDAWSLSIEWSTATRRVRRHFDLWTIFNCRNNPLASKNGMQQKLTLRRRVSVSQESFLSCPQMFHTPLVVGGYRSKMFWNIIRWDVTLLYSLGWRDAVTAVVETYFLYATNH